MIIDTHAHVASARFDHDREAVLERATAAGVGRIIAPATDLADCVKLAEICRRHDGGVFMTTGIHPCDAHTVSGNDWLADLREHARGPKVAAIGEIGLDYFHPPPEGFDTTSWRRHQAQVLNAQLQLAAELGLNVVLHNRESWDDLVALVEPFRGRLRAVFHCYTGTLDQARPLLAAGHLISFTGIVTFKNSGVIAQTAKEAPPGSFMLETDSPYLSPVPYRGQRCEPAFVTDTARFVANLRGVTLDEVAENTTQTARSFFQGL